MKKLTVIILTLAMLFALCACGSTATDAGKAAAQKAEDTQKTEQKTDDTAKEPENAPADTEDAPAGNMAGMANPMTEYESLAEINDLTGGKLCTPPVMGVTGHKYFTINCGDYTIAELDYEVNGNPWTFRFAPIVSEDISGIYTADGTAFSKEPSGETIDYYFADDCMAARWFNIDGQYVLSLANGSLYDEETFKMLVEESYNLTFPGMSEADLEAYYASLAGDYQDSMSKRAMAVVTAHPDCIEIEIHWGSSAWEAAEWIMTAKRYEDGLLSYNNCVAKTVVTDENGNSEETFEEFPESGWFVETDGILYWSGSGDEQTENMAFEKIDLG